MILRTGNIVWTAATFAVMLGGSTLSLRVASERKAVETLKARIARDEAGIETLRAEVSTRSGMQEMQRWNDQVLRLAAPSARQFVGDPVQLASFVAPHAELPATAPAPQLAIAEAPAAAPSALHTVAYTPAAAPVARRAAPRLAPVEAVRVAALTTRLVTPRPSVAAPLSLDNALVSTAAAPAHLTQVALR